MSAPASGTYVDTALQQGVIAWVDEFGFEYRAVKNGPDTRNRSGTWTIQVRTPGGAYHPYAVVHLHTTATPRRLDAAALEQ